MQAYPEISVPSPNFSASPQHERLGVLVHHSVMSYADTVRHMSNVSSRVSYHVLISPAGERCTFVADEHVAWHAGVSTFRGREHCNQFLLGLSFAGDTYREPLTAAQIASALEWLGPRWDAYNWSAEWIVDHRQVAPGRKDDLNPSEWARFQSALVEWAQKKAASQLRRPPPYDTNQSAR